MRPSALVALLLAAVTLGACSGSFNRADSGTVIGAVAGGIIGNQVGDGAGRTVATIAGAAIGGIVGHEIGAALDQQDRMYAQRAEFSALEEGRSGEPVSWRNPDSGRYGEVIPDRSYERAGNTCREYTHRVYIDGRPQTMRGTACRERDGTWRNVG
ncbi:MAG: RT0821/Lpp0805 family surface protein [Pseudomonadota bacterium]